MIIRENASSYTLELNAGVFRVAIIDGVNPTQVLQTTGTLSNNVWQHVAAVMDNGTLHLYINGVLDVTLPNSRIPRDTNLPLSFSAGRNPAGNFYDGAIDEVRIWNRALAAGELGRRFNSPQTDLVGWWGFNEGTGDTFVDRSGNGNTGRLGSQVGPDGNDPPWILATLPVLP